MPNLERQNEMHNASSQGQGPKGGGTEILFITSLEHSQNSYTKVHTNNDKKLFQWLIVINTTKIDFFCFSSTVGSNLICGARLPPFFPHFFTFMII